MCVSLILVILFIVLVCSTSISIMLYDGFVRFALKVDIVDTVYDYYDYYIYYCICMNINALLFWQI